MRPRGLWFQGMISFLRIALEWFDLVSLAFCIGVIVCRGWVFPAPSGAVPGYGSRPPDIWRWFCVGVGVMLACTIMDLLLRASDMGETSIFSVFPVLPLVLFRTHFGGTWIVRILAEILLLISLKISIHRDSRGALVFMLLLAGVIAWTKSASGHASDAGDFSLAEITDLFHLLATSVWGGGLLVLSLFLLPQIVHPDDDRAAVRIAGVAVRFSRIAGYAVAIVAITALYNGYSYVGSLEALWKSSYGLIVIVKTCLFLLLVNLGAFNRYISVPLLQEWAGASAEDRGAFTRAAIRIFPKLSPEEGGYRVALRFTRSVRVEAMFIVGMLLCAALLRHEVPARHLHHLGHTGETMHMEHGGGSPTGHEGK